MMMRMMKMSPLLLLLGLAVTSTAAAGPDSCVGRCGEVFTRGQQCNCDFNCLQHNECCLDFQTTCTTAQSCQGRCGEAFRRGRLCECDPQCIQFNTCCHDYHQQHCDASVSVSHTRIVQPVRPAASGNQGSGGSRRMSNSASEEWFTGVRNILVSHGRAPVPPGRGSSLPSHSAPSLGSGAPVSPSGHGAVDGPSGAAVTQPRPSTLQDIAQALGLTGAGLTEAGLTGAGLTGAGPQGAVPQGAGTGLFADANLCSDSPINGLTALSNGTILIFKGDLLWSVDAVSRSVSRPQSITDTLGVPSPIDTVFTRCNCHGHTYIIKGDQYWRLDRNMVMEPGYPRPLVSEFPGLTGSISAALAAPATGSRAETVYFFKSGDIMQGFTFPPGSTPSCSKKPRSSSRTRVARQAEVLLNGEINIKVSLMGFPTPITAALSMPSPQRRDPYEHYVFSGPLFFSVKISKNLPALVKPPPSAVLAPQAILSPVAVATNMAAQNDNAHLPANSIGVWLRCP